MGEFLTNQEKSTINSSKYTEEQIKQFSSETIRATYKDRFAIYLGSKLRSAEREPGNESLAEEIKRRLAGRNLVDLGCGPEIIYHMNDSVAILKAQKSEEELPFLIKLARQAGIKSYTGVDLSESFVRNVPEAILKGKESDAVKKHFSILGFDLRLVNDDMLHYIHTLPDNSSCYTMNGIASDLIMDTEKNWSRALYDELGRTMAPGGILFGCDSSYLKRKNLGEVGLEPLNDSLADTSDFFVYTKE